MGRNAILIAVGLTFVAVALVVAMGRGGDVAVTVAAPHPAAAATSAPATAPAPAAAAATTVAARAAPPSDAAVPASAPPAAAPTVAPRFGPVHGDPVDPAKLDADTAHMQAIGALIVPEAAKVFERCVGAAGGALQLMSFQLELSKVAAAAAGGRPQVGLSSIQPSSGMVGQDSDASPQWQRCSTELREVRVELPKVHDAAPEHGFITVMIQVPEPFAVRLAAASAGAKAPSEVAK